MSQNREMVETVKRHFSRKSTNQLEAILESNDIERWSNEAFEAARELIVLRRTGTACEPPTQEQESPPASGHSVNSLAVIAGLNVLTFPLGVIELPFHGPLVQDEVAADIPLPFGWNAAWLALNTTNAESVAASLGLRNVRQSTWEYGLQAANGTSIFVTPPLGQWTLAVGLALMPSHHPDELVAPVLQRLSAQFEEAQYFCSRREVRWYVWAQAENGRIGRAFAWMGPFARTQWDVGSPSREERNLQPSADDSVEYPTEDSVFQLAYLWSVDPTILGEEYKEPKLGLLGEAPS